MTIELAKAQATAAFHQERAANAEYLTEVWKKRALEGVDVKTWQECSRYWQGQAELWCEIAQELNHEEAWKLYDQKKGFSDE